MTVAIGDRKTYYLAGRERSVTVVATRPAADATLYVVAWPSRVALDPLYPGQATAAVRDSDLR